MKKERKGNIVENNELTSCTSEDNMTDYYLCEEERIEVDIPSYVICTGLRAIGKVELIDTAKWYDGLFPWIKLSRQRRLMKQVIGSSLFDKWELKHGHIK